MHETLHNFLKARTDHIERNDRSNTVQPVTPKRVIDEANNVITQSMRRPSTRDESTSGVRAKLLDRLNKTFTTVAHMDHSPSGEPKYASAMKMASPSIRYESRNNNNGGGGMYAT